jgi:phage head maturation protease
MASSTKAPYGDVTYADPGYQADGQKRYPVDTEEHAKAAWSYINQAGNAAKYSSEHLAAVKGRIKAALRKFGVQISEDDTSSRSESLAPYFRSFPLEDIHIRSSGDGRTVEAYAAVFGIPAEVRDQDGHYMEEIDPAAFNKAISDAAPQGSRRGWKVGVFYNHGMTIHGTPSERGAMPVGVPLEITADSRGLKTVTKYHRGEFCDEILDRIREGSLPGYSFTGNFRRSQPLVPRGGFRPNFRTGELPHVRRTESTLVEYGPTPMPIYEGAAVTAMRADSLLGAMAANPELAQRMISMLSGSTPGEPLPETGTPFDEEQPPRSRLVHSGRPVKQEIQAARSAFLQRQHRR